MFFYYESAGRLNNTLRENRSLAGIKQQQRRAGDQLSYYCPQKNRKPYAKLADTSPKAPPVAHTALQERSKGFPIP